MGELCVFSDKGDDAPCIVYIIVKDKVMWEGMHEFYSVLWEYKLW